MTDHQARQPPASEPRLGPLEAMLRRDFASERQQTSADREMDQLAVDRVMFLARQTKSATRRSKRPWRMAVRRRPTLALAAAALFVGGVAAAVLSASRAPSAPVPLGLAPPAPTPSLAPVRPLHQARAADLPEQPQQPTRTSPSSDRSPEQHAKETKPSAGVQSQPSAAMLFERANRLRREGRARSALGEYKKLQARYPSARETQLSHAISGRLHLQLSQPAYALQQFDSYLARGGAAAQDALAGRADAYRQLGNAGRERSAWQRLLRTFPKSVHAERARARLKALE